MKKIFLTGLCIMMVALAALSASAHDKRKTVMGYKFTGTWDGPGEGPSEGVQLIYDYGSLLDFIDDEEEVYVCKYFSNYNRWIPMRDAVKDLPNNEVRFYENHFPQKWALCIIDDEVDCEHMPSTSTFEEGSTDFSALSATDIDPLVDPTVDLKLKKNNADVDWAAGSYDLCGAPLDDAVSMSGSHVAVDVHAVYDLNTTGTVTMEDIDCSSFTLYYCPNYHTSASDIIDDGESIAVASSSTPSGGDCSPSSICSDVVCTGTTLTFTAYHFDGFAGQDNGGGEGGDGIPEFSTYGIILMIILVSIGTVVIIKKK